MQKYITGQQGGTLVGVIIGLIIGLAIALGIALAITKTPIPFMNKFSRPDKSNEVVGNQVTDPNKPLHGNKNASKEAKKFAKAPAEGVPPANQVIEKKPEPPKDEKVAAIELFSGDKPKGPAAKVSETKERLPTKTESDKWNYYLQAGAFRNPTDAENTRAKLALIGIEGRVTERQSENGTLYRVQAGPFAQLDAMNKARGKLSDNGVDVAVVRISR